MTLPCLKKYQPQNIEEFKKDKDIIEIINILIDMESLNILLIGDHGSGKTSLVDAIIRKYYKTDAIPVDNVIYINKEE